VTDVFSYITFDDPWDGVRPFELEVVTEDDRQTFILRGELDITSAGRVGSMVSRTVSAATSALILDLSEVTYMDSTGLRMIIAARQLCKEHGTAFALVPGPPEVQRLFELTGAAKNLSFTGAAPVAPRQRAG
jgi:anti-anti-sigma factor